MGLADSRTGRPSGKIDGMRAGGWDETVGLGRGQNTAPVRATDFVALAPPDRASGVTLTELLVAILVMSAGALGLAGLQAESLRAGREACERSVAVQRAVDMMDRIRANPAVAASEFAVGAGPPAFVDCLRAVCGPREMARFDIALWKCALAAGRDVAACARIREAGALPGADAMPGLPEGDGTVVVDAATDVVTVTVLWHPPGGAFPLRIAMSSRA